MVAFVRFGDRVMCQPTHPHDGWMEVEDVGLFCSAAAKTATEAATAKPFSASYRVNQSVARPLDWITVGETILGHEALRSYHNGGSGGGVKRACGDS